MIGTFYSLPYLIVLTVLLGEYFFSLSTWKLREVQKLD